MIPWKFLFIRLITRFFHLFPAFLRPSNVGNSFFFCLKFIWLCKQLSFAYQWNGVGDLFKSIAKCKWKLLTYCAHLDEYTARSFYVRFLAPQPRTFSSVACVWCALFMGSGFCLGRCGDHIPTFKEMSIFPSHFHCNKDKSIASIFAFFYRWERERGFSVRP